MSDSSGDDKPAAIPSWQASVSSSDAPAPAADKQTEDTLAVARRFLQEEQVQSAPREKQVSFLKTKGVSDEDIEKLLGEAKKSEADEQKTESRQEVTATTQSKDRAPIVTYPEFLTKPQRPPPLVTSERLFNTLYACVGLSTLVYGASKYLVKPMVDSLNQSRGEIHETTASQLDALITQLEKTVSVVPPAAATAAEEESDSEDPAEMFHRDVGTQTVFPTTTPKSSAAEVPAHAQHATNLAKLAKSLSALRDDVRSQSTGFEGMKTQLDGFRDDLDAMTFGAAETTTFEMFGAPRKVEPNDEIRAVRDNIRRIKGVLLSTRTFPTSR
ncbi:hypothetical protein VHEMI04541 [[Torrubiella] hemipterigena]|uniref:Peroxisomal membrane protein PEX14 n=1 Tax=[Torrubiella] hemipterigena TaxID=1531966 RepID=A0A0A1TEQ2_9HYPO|nr:hypothetical protein VHEMI04541 [[Torrubiella] hemipterigena]